MPPSGETMCVQGGTCIMVGDDQEWIAQASKVAAATFGCKPFSKTLFHIPTGGSHDQETFNHENFETKCAGVLLTTCSEALSVHLQALGL